MEEIQMRVEHGNVNGSRHLKSAHQQRPVEALSVECNQHRPLPEPSGEFQQDRIFLGGIAHEELFDLNSVPIPQRQAGQERQTSRTAYESSRFGSEKEPFLGIGCMICAEWLARRSGAEQKLQDLR